MEALLIEADLDEVTFGENHLDCGEIRSLISLPSNQSARYNSPSWLYFTWKPAFVIRTMPSTCLPFSKIPPIKRGSNVGGFECQARPHWGKIRRAADSDLKTEVGYLGTIR
jgi:hypothetical protein